MRNLWGVLSLTQLSLIIVFMGGVKHAQADSKTFTIALAGDSTVTDQAGWGAGFARLLNEQTRCLNFAAGGRSSRSFRTEGRWEKCLEAKPDYVLIQFGHNDQPGKGPQRETSPETTYKEFLRAYVKEAREAGAIPVLITSLTRRRFDDQGKIQSTLTPYAKAVIDVGKELNVPVIDLHSRSIELCEKIGPQACEEISPPGKGDAPDRTHLNSKGADMIAPLIQADLVKVVPELATCFRK